MSWMKGQGINRVKLHAYSWNIKARELYQRNGFKEYVVSYEAFI
ncbi:GNAT family N-acetyltransferase [Alkaliphilus pronyensis]|uniref:GNAT family N-acetyltransferase n=1 Tax=Alkaliphilus pronyensis TaxID=1482732 RepID=A0A6I0FQE0_9FIRM|nr:GNAT family N-acetyltransferase [Alkaliphilus pronyensis]KAB3538544.1 GNAT family N-acetyltransferase [Alkaliphilus pronyensis]